MSTELASLNYNLCAHTRGWGRCLSLKFRVRSYRVQFLHMASFRAGAILRLRESALQGIHARSASWGLRSRRAAMECYVGLDVSLKLTAICIVDRTGKIEREGTVPSDPEAIATFVKTHAAHVARVGLETGATATWLWTELNKLGLPVICIDARHAKAALKMQINKSDRNDAVGIARIMQCGWYKEIRVKDLDSHATKALLVSRALLVKIKRDIENQIRGLLKNLGLVIGRAKMNMFALRAAELTADRPELAAAVTPLLNARVGIAQQIAD